MDNLYENIRQALIEGKYEALMRKALGVSRLPKDHNYTSSVATNGDFVVHDGGGRVIGRIKKGEHDAIKEEVEQIDELSKKTLAKYIPAAAKDAERAGAHQEYFGNDQDYRDGKNRQKGIERAVKKLAKEEAEQIDELSTDKLRKYRALARFDADDAHAVNDDRRLRKRSFGANQAGKKILKRGESLRSEESHYEKNAADTKKTFPNVKHLTKDGHPDWSKHDIDSGLEDELKSQRQTKKSVEDAKKKYGVKEEVEQVDEARGRPKKVLDHVVNPNNKEKLYFDNPEHMKRIEKLRKNGVLPPVKKEPAEHIINRMGQAATNMTGGQHITYDNGKTHKVTNALASKTLQHYRGLKPAEKEDFQKRIARSHEEHLAALSGK